MWKKILVPLDRSIASKRALREAVGVAKQMDAVIHVMHVVSPFIAGLGWEEVDPTFRVTVMEEKKKFGAELVMQAAKKVREAGITVESQSVVVGAPEQEIVTSVKEKGCDVVIMGTHGRKSLEKMTIGTVAQYAIQRAGVPVMCLRGVDDGNLDGPIDTARIAPLKRIVFPFDNSDVSNETLRKLAIPLCQATKAELHLRFQIEHPSSFRLIDTETVVTKVTQEAEDFLKAAGAQATETLGKGKVFTKVAVTGEHVADGLCECANDYDLVILSTHGRRALKRLFMGSVAESILRSCNTPVVTYHPIHPNLKKTIPYDPIRSVGN